MSNALVQHQNSLGHNPKFEEAKLIRRIRNRRLRQLFEAATIQNSQVIPQKPGMFQLAKNIGRLLTDCRYALYEVG